MFLQELLPHSPEVARLANLPSEPQGPSDCPGPANRGGPVSGLAFTSSRPRWLCRPRTMQLTECNVYASLCK